MIALLHIDIFETCFNGNQYSVKKNLYHILYNQSIEICFTKNYIDLIERKITNADAFQALIKELYDTNRIKLETSVAQKDDEQEFLEIARQSKIPTLIPVIEDDIKSLALKIPSLLIVKKATPTNDHWVKLELLRNNFCNVCYQQFKSDADILDFFDSIFSVPKYIQSVTIFNREQHVTLLKKLKGCNIEYYTILSGSPASEHIRRQIKDDLRKELGNRLRLFYTSNARNIHERKIIFNNLIVTVDNSHNNLTIAEPTWEILISYDKLKALKWKQKISKFKEVIG